jgi:hypothetical protein
VPDKSAHPALTWAGLSGWQTIKASFAVQVGASGRSRGCSCHSIRPDYGRAGEGVASGVSQRAVLQPATLDSGDSHSPKIENRILGPL